VNSPPPAGEAGGSAAGGGGRGVDTDGAEGDWNALVNAPGSEGGAVRPGCGGSVLCTGDPNERVNSPTGCCGGGAEAWGGAAGFAGGMVEVGGEGDLNICVNSPGCGGGGGAEAWGGAEGFAGGMVEVGAEGD